MLFYLKKRTCDNMAWPLNVSITFHTLIVTMLIYHANVLICKYITINYYLQ